MDTESLFRRLPNQDEAVQEHVRIYLDGQSLLVPEGISVAAALLLQGLRAFHSSAVNLLPRAPYCMMGVCFECLVEIDDKPNQQACLTTVRDEMVIRSMVIPGSKILANSEVSHG